MAEPGTRTIGMMADAYWCAAPLPLRLAVLTFSKRETLDHQGQRLRIGWLWGVPYLLAASAPPRPARPKPTEDD